MNATESRAEMQKRMEARATANLLIDLEILEGMAEVARLNDAAKMTKAMIADTIVTRHGLDDLMEAIYVEDLNFTGTHTDAIHEALRQQAAA